MINANSTYNTVDSTLIKADNYSISCYLVGTGNRDLNNPLNWSSTSGGTPADVLGSELLSGWNFTSGWSLSGGTIIDLNSFSSAGVGGIFKSGLLTIGKSYKCTISGVTTAGNLTVREATNNLIYSPVLSGTFNSTFYFIALQTSIYLRNSSAGQTDISSFTIQEVLSVPNSSNPAIIDANSLNANGNILTQSAQFDCGGFDCSAAAYTFTLSNAAYAFNVYGDLKDSIKRTNGFSSTGYLYFKGSSNIYSNGATQGWNRIYKDAPGATFTNQDDWNVGSSTTLAVINGIWNSNAKIINAGALSTYQANSATINISNSLITIGLLQIYYYSNLSLITTSSTITVTLNWLRGGGYTYNNIISTYGDTISSTNCGDFICQNFTRQATSGAIGFALPLSADITVQNTLTLIGYNAQNYRLLVASNTIGTPRTITCNGSIVASNVDFRDITLAGTANRDLSAISGGSGDCGGNSGITFTSSQTQYYKHTSGACQWSDATKWVTSSGGSIQGRVPLPQDDPIFDQNSFTGASTLSVNCPRIGRSLNMEGVNQAITFSLANAITSYGGQRFSNNVSLSGNYLWTFDGHGRTFDKVYIGVPSSFVNNLVLIGNNTFNELIIEKGRKVQITGGSTQTISPTGKLIADGTPTEQIQITSTNTTPFNLVYAGTGFHQVNYCNISYCNATADRFYAGKNSTDGGNNTGWKFRSYLAQNTQIL